MMMVFWLFLHVVWCVVVSGPQMGLAVVAVVAGAGGRQLEALDGEREVVVVRIVDQEPVVHRLLDALGQVALWDKGAGGSRSQTLFHPGSLAQLLVVGFHVVDDNPPVAFGVDGSKGPDVANLGGAQERLVLQDLEPVHRVLRVGKHVLYDKGNIAS